MDTFGMDLFAQTYQKKLNIISYFPHKIRIPANLKPLFLNPIVPKCQYT